MIAVSRSTVAGLMCVGSLLGSSTCWAQDDPSPSDTVLSPFAVVQPRPAAEAVSPLQPLPVAEPQPVPAPLTPAAAAPLTAAPTATPVAPVSAVEPSAVAVQEVLRQAMEQLEPARLPNLETARGQLRSAITDLESFIQVETEGGQAWSRFLQLEQLKQAIEQEQPDRRQLVDLQMNMRQNYAGLELAPFRAVRDGLQEVIRALRYGYDPEKNIEQLKGRMQLLVERLNEPTEGAASDRSTAVGLIANYLHETGQVPWAVERIRQQFSVPNLRVYAREDFLNRVLMRPVAQPSSVNECLLGTRLVGQACLSGNLTVDVVPMVGGASMNFNLSATMNSTNRGYNRGVVLLSSGTSPVFASKQVFITPNGLSSLPASVATNLQTTIHEIQHRLRIVRKIATKKAAEQKPKAEAIAQGRLQNRVREGYDQQVDEQLAEANVQFAAFQGEPRPELQRLGVARPLWNLSSSDIAIHGDFTQADKYQLAADKASPLPPPSESQVVVEAHQSALMNAIDVIAGDRTIRNVDLDDYAMQATGKVPEDVQREAEGEPWSITLAAYRPVEVEFDNGRIKVTLRIASMTRGDQSLYDDATVTASYIPTHEAGVLTLSRQGEAEVVFTRTSRGIRAVTLRSFLKGKFDAFFKEQIVTEPIDFTKWFPKAPPLSIDTLQVDDGWLQLGVH